MTIQLVDMAEQHLADNFGKSILQPVAPSDPLRVAHVRKCVCHAAGRAQISLPATNIAASSMADIAGMVRRGVLTPEHVIHNKPFPAVITDDVEASIHDFSERYDAYVDRANDPDLLRLTTHPHCLLYTSPSPRDATLSRMPSSA